MYNQVYIYLPFVQTWPKTNYFMQFWYATILDDMATGKVDDDQRLNSQKTPVALYLVTWLFKVNANGRKHYISNIPLAKLVLSLFEGIFKKCWNGLSLELNECFCLKYTVYNSTLQIIKWKKT